MNVYIISGYSGFMLPFGESLKAILMETFKKLGHKAYHIYDITYNLNVDNSLFLFIMSPETLIDKIKFVQKNKNKFIFWNIEPYSNTPDAHPKYQRRKQALLDILANKGNVYNIDHVWCYDKDQVEWLKSSRCSFMPIGMADCLIPSKKSLRMYANKRRVVFLGLNNNYRKTFFNVINSKLKAVLKSAEVKFAAYDYDKYVDFNTVLNKLAMYNVGIDIRSTEYSDRYVRWHRLMHYAAARVVIVSDVPLEKYGLVHGTHYFYYDGALTAAKIVDELLKNHKMLLQVANSMFNKALQDFQMHKLIKKEFKRLGV